LSFFNVWGEEKWLARVGISWINWQCVAMELLAKHRTVTTEERYAASAVKYDCLTSISNDTDNMV